MILRRFVVFRSLSRVPRTVEENEISGKDSPVRRARLCEKFAPLLSNVSQAARFDLLRPRGTGSIDSSRVNCTEILAHVARDSASNRSTVVPRESLDPIVTAVSSYAWRIIERSVRKLSSIVSVRNPGKTQCGVQFFEKLI